ncbi:MAG: DUF4339 domain-containing protein [Planctomycetaceae bacterium]|nr:MAG: DUF4339 domain-containing protein [Planctomycetaceae bacterium]
MSTQPSAWYVRGEGDQPAGPYSAEQLFQLLRAGRVTPETICWREGLPQWLPLGEVEPFAAALSGSTQGSGSRGAPHQGGPAVMPRGLPSAGRVSGAMLSRHLPVIAGCTTAVMVFLMVLLGAALMRGKQAGNAPDRDGRAATRNEEAPLAVIIRDFAARRQDAFGPQHTVVQREAAHADAVRQLREDLDSCGPITFTGLVEDINRVPSFFSRPRGDMWQIEMTVPEELADLVQQQICSIRITLSVHLDETDALSISKGDPVFVEGPVSYPAGGSIAMGPNSSAVITVTQPEGAPLFRDYRFTLQIGQNATCSAGAIRAIRMVGHDRG